MHVTNGLYVESSITLITFIETVHTIIIILVLNITFVSNFIDPLSNVPMLQNEGFMMDSLMKLYDNYVFPDN